MSAEKMIHPYLTSRTSSSACVIILHCITKGEGAFFTDAHSLLPTIINSGEVIQSSIQKPVYAIE